MGEATRKLLEIAPEEAEMETVNFCVCERHAAVVIQRWQEAHFQMMTTVQDDQEARRPSGGSVASTASWPEYDPSWHGEGAMSQRGDSTKKSLEGVNAIGSEPPVGEGPTCASPTDGLEGSDSGAQSSGDRRANDDDRPTSDRPDDGSADRRKKDDHDPPDGSAGGGQGPP